MHLDVVDLRQFYYRTRLGRIAQKAVRDRMLSLWPAAQVKAQTVVGFGFAAPLLRPYLAPARRVTCLMPGQQGVMPWPPGLPNISALCDEKWWPIGTGTVDRLICLHGLETSETPSAVLDEAARTLAPDGRLMVIVPHRRGLWARRDVTPFGFGRPYSLGQLEAQVRAHGFVPERHVAALFAPPSDSRTWLRSADLIEKVGRRLSSSMAGGVILLEACKEVPAPTRPGLAERVRRPLRVLEGIGTPAPEPSRRG